MPVWREADEADREFFQQLDAWLCGWLHATEGLDVGQLLALVDMQSRAREQAYRSAWPQARCLVVEQEEAGTPQPVGRIWYCHTANALHLIDISLLPKHQRRGLGGACMEQLIGEAAAAGLAVTLHVAEDNPAHRLYSRLGFRCVEHKPPYLQLRLDTSPMLERTGAESRVPGAPALHSKE
ncbi:MAG: GNAT family N-acetyltransferase [Zoogloeaceae bacterium]|nr:GNAT family N-acetyltransferase [Zoogloeaceae bacterium]